MINERFPSGRLRLFESDLLERFTIITPKAFAATWAAYIGFVLYLIWGTAGPAASIALVLSGLLLWTLFEYAMHRFVFHLRLTSARGKRLIYLSHGNHHVMPNDRYRNIMPPLVSIAICSTMWAVLWLAFGALGTVIYLGFIIGYVIYDIVHFACHQYSMRYPILRQLRRHHIRHHHADEDGNFAITAIFWDRVFGTEVQIKGRGAVEPGSIGKDVSAAAGRQLPR